MCIIFYIPPHGVRNNNQTTNYIVVLCMIITIWLHAIYECIVLVICKEPILSVLLITTITQPHIVQNHREPQHPRRSRSLQNLPPILGGIPHLDDTSAQPSHTPVSVIVIGSSFLGSTFLNNIIQRNPPTSPPPQGGGNQPLSQGTRSQPSPHGTFYQPSHTMVGTPPSMPYLASINIIDLTKLMNDPILHDRTWPNIPTKLPYDILKFEGKHGEYPANHIMYFHLWCSSNSIMEYFFLLQLFQITLIGPSSKWYVDEKVGSHSTFESLVKAFLYLFQILVCHETGLEILSKLKIALAIHIADDIHEWQRRRSICKVDTTPQQ
jgi:hypothetical protein